MKIILSFDIEGNFHKYIHSPYIWHKKERTEKGVKYTYSKSKINSFKNYLKWNLINHLPKWASGKRGIRNIIYFLKKSRIPASLNICGYLYSEKEAPKIRIDIPWAIGKVKRRKYYFVRDKNLYFAEFIKSSGLINNPDIDFGIHGFIHEAFALEKPKIMDEILRESIKAGKKLGIQIKTFVPPFNMLFNNNQKKVMEIMRKNNITCIRYAGGDDFFKDFEHSTAISSLKVKDGIKLVHLSDSLEGTDPKKRVYEIVDKIKHNYNRNAIFCIMCHDYSFKKPDNLFLLLNELKKIEKKYPLKFTNLRDV